MQSAWLRMWCISSAMGLGGVLLAGCEEAHRHTEQTEDTQDDPAGEAQGSGNTGTPDGGLSADTNVALVRFNADGSRDLGFGAGGVAVVDFSSGNASARDSLWGMAVDAQDRLVLFGAKKAANPRVDTDRVVARLTANGSVDTLFAENGIHTLNVANLNDSARAGFVQADGKIVASGYTAQPTGVGTQSANRIVLLRLQDDGKPDPTFGSEGVVNSAPFTPADPVTTPWGMAEAYAVGYQSGSYITTGYGREAASGQVDVVSFRFNSAGVRDTSFGTGGVAQLDVAGDNDRGRALAVLPDGRILVAGSATPNASNVNALIQLLEPNGQPDTSFGTGGHKLFDFGRADDSLFGLAVSPDGKWAVATGYRAGPVGGSAEDDDATLVLLPLGDSGSEFAQAVPLSETEHDRFWAATFDAQSRVIAAGFLAEGEDTQMVVARFDSAGTLDPSFGVGGKAVVNVVPGGSLETARALVIQSDGKIVLAGVVEAPAP